MSLRLRMPFKSFEYSEIEFNNYIYEDEEVDTRGYGYTHHK